MVRGRPRMFTDEEVRAFYALYQQGIVPRVLVGGDEAAALNLYVAFRRLGLPKLTPKPHPKRYRGRDVEIVALHNQGLSNAEIGRRYKLTRERVAQILESQGIPRPPKHGV